MSRRLQIVLPDPVAVQLRELAAAAGEPPSTLAAHIVRNGVSDAARQGRVSSLRATVPVDAGKHAGRPGWLEPSGGDPGWRRLMWGAIVALHGRYPRLLEAMKQGWWTDQVHTEILCALVVWRGEIDDAGASPREELAFHRELAGYAHALRQQGGGVSKAWVPGAPPDDWARGA